MRYSHRVAALASTLALSLLLGACGGGGAGAPAAATTLISADVAAQIATDGFTRFNVRRQQMGLSPLIRTGTVDNSSAGHSNYQRVNDVITHDQVPGSPAFTGRTLEDRLKAAGYIFTVPSPIGEVIAASGDLNGTNNAEDLITAIYHRYVIFEPTFQKAGAGSSGLSATGYNFFTVELVADGFGGGIGPTNLAIYPSNNQTDIVPVFFHRQESPDPFPSTFPNAQVGYPVSVHADYNSVVNVSSFTIQPRGGLPLETRLLISATDPTRETPPSAAAIIPIYPLAPATVYDVFFSGSVSGLPVTRTWSFATR